MDLDKARLTFVEESRDLLQSMEEILLQAESGACDEESVNALFRSAHTIKGSAGLFGLDPIVAFTHGVESVLDRVRNGDLALDRTLVGLLLECRDHIGVLVTDLAERGQPTSSESATVGETLQGRLQVYLEQPKAPSAGTPAVRDTPVEHLGTEDTAADTWQISLRFGPEVFRNGMDPLSFIRYLAQTDTVVHVETITDRIPAVDEMDPESCYLGFHIALRSARDKVAIEAVFDFVRDDCSICILPPHSKVEQYVELIAELPEHPMRVGDILLKSGALTPRELELALAAQADQRARTGEATKPLGEILVAGQLAPGPAVNAALDKQGQIAERRLQESRLVKVPAERLDALVDLVGELVIAGASTSVLASRGQDASLIEATSVVARLVEEIRDAALRLRMVQIGGVFNRFPRVVRDLAKDIGKDIDLQLSGTETELDKSMIEHIADPLMHLVRNAVDHGIEAADLRAARGKPARGLVRLSAAHETGSIVIEVSDDGGGLDRDKIRSKAIDRGLLAPEQDLSDADLFQLVLEPGFSTATEVTNLSGRGVGMDVVKRNIEALRGVIEIESRPGVGSTFRLRMPLTLAIIDGFLVQVDTACYVIPLDAVVECVGLDQAAKAETVGRSYINLRDQVLPFVRLREVFELELIPPTRENIVVVQYGGKRAGLVVDQLLGELQAVIKPLSKVFSGIRGVGGSTILGSGEVALILDVPGLLQLATEAETVALAGKGMAETSRLRAVGEAR